jgi:monoamine oxidase
LGTATAKRVVRKKTAKTKIAPLRGLRIQGAEAPAYDVDVVIVGGGFAGLSAADRINQHNLHYSGQQISFVVLDGDPRRGGRTSTVRPDLGFLDLGGQYLTDPARLDDRGVQLQPYLHELVDRFGIELSDVEVDPNRVRVIETVSGGRIETKTELPDDPVLAEFVARIETHVNILKDYLGHPWDAPNAVQLDQMSVQAWSRGEAPNPVVDELVTIGVEAAYSVEPRDISFLHYLHYGATCRSFKNYELDGESRRFKNGTIELYEAMVDDLPPDTVRRSQKVVRIERDASAVTVTTFQGLTFRARRLIVAMSPRASRAITWVPEQTEARKALCDGGPTARTIKGFAVFYRAFWQPKYAGYSISSVGPIVWVKEVTTTMDDGTVIPTLMLFVVGDQAEPWSRKTMEEKKQAIFTQLARTFNTSEGEVSACFREYIEKDWAQDGFALGCPAGCFRPNVLTRLLDGEPIGKSLATPDGLTHFAGSETGTDWQGGYINGAVQSGQRAAHEVINALGVTSTYVAALVGTVKAARAKKRRAEKTPAKKAPAKKAPAKKTPAKKTPAKKSLGAFTRSRKRRGASR